MRIFDCFTFYNEFDLLEIRLAELYEVVDRFVLVESDVSFANNPKRMLFAENRERYRTFADKIIYVPVTDMPRATDNPWERERFQRNAILRGLKDAGQDDYVIISDVDEIPRGPVISSLAQQGADGYGLRLWFFSLRLNLMNLAGPELHCVWPVMLRRRFLTTPEIARTMRVDIDNGKSYRAIDNCGWHFTSIGDNETVRNKIRNFSHQELNRSEILQAIDVDSIVQDGRDLFGRDRYAWGPVPPELWMPSYVLNNIERFSHLLTKYDDKKSAELLARALIASASNYRTKPPASLRRILFERLLRLVRGNADH